MAARVTVDTYLIRVSLVGLLLVFHRRVRQLFTQFTVPIITDDILK